MRRTLRHHCQQHGHEQHGERLWHLGLRSYKTVSVDNNTVINVDVGLAVFGDSGVPTTTKPRLLDGQTRRRQARRRRQAVQSTLMNSGQS